MHVDVTTRGPVGRKLARDAAERMTRLERLTHAPLQRGRIVLERERNPRIARGARAVGELYFAGRPVRVHVVASRMDAAVDALTHQLEAQLRRRVDRIIAGKRTPARRARRAGGR